ncbi:MAG: hypothetical protein HOO06_07440 [Bdellovibrionaceae bacterium]|jgi:hypothetical protein|nr:hypothetical protein [Pseudobdellovibrionaceae bacterium]
MNPLIGELLIKIMAVNIFIEPEIIEKPILKFIDEIGIEKLGKLDDNNGFSVYVKGYLGSVTEYEYLGASDPNLTEQEAWLKYEITKDGDEFKISLSLKALNTVESDTEYEVRFGEYIKDKTQLMFVKESLIPAGLDVTHQFKHTDKLITTIKFGGDLFRVNKYDKLNAAEMTNGAPSGEVRTGFIFNFRLGIEESYLYGKNNEAFIGLDAEFGFAEASARLNQEAIDNLTVDTDYDNNGRHTVDMSEKRLEFYTGWRKTNPNKNQYTVIFRSQLTDAVTDFDVWGGESYKTITDNKGDYSVSFTYGF